MLIIISRKITRFIKLMKDELLKKKPKNKHFGWAISEDKYLDLDKVRKLRSVMKTVKDRAAGELKLFAVRDWLMVDMGLFTGLRVEEMVDLKISDLHFKGKQSSLVVRNGKGNKARVVHFSGVFASECLFYLGWRDKTLAKSDYLFTNHNGRQLTKRALQKAFKRCAKLANLEPRYSIHCLRHTYATHLLKSSNYNLRLVQEQLGHSSIRTTQVYASVMDDDIKRAVDKIYQT